MNVESVLRWFIFDGFVLDVELFVFDCDNIFGSIFIRVGFLLGWGVCEEDFYQLLQKFFVYVYVKNFIFDIDEYKIYVWRVVEYGFGWDGFLCIVVSGWIFKLLIVLVNLLNNVD